MSKFGRWWQSSYYNWTTKGNEFTPRGMTPYVLRISQPQFEWRKRTYEIPSRLIPGEATITRDEIIGRARFVGTLGGGAVDWLILGGAYAGIRPLMASAALFKAMHLGATADRRGKDYGAAIPREAQGGFELAGKGFLLAGAQAGVSPCSVLGGLMGEVLAAALTRPACLKKTAPRSVDCD